MLIAGFLIGIVVGSGVTYYMRPATPIVVTVPPLGKDKILIGGTLPLSGFAAADGERFLRGMQLAVDMINERGGILGAKLELKILDDAMDPTRVGSLYESLITQYKVDILLAPYGAPMTLPALLVAEKYNKLMITGYTSSKQISERYGGKIYFSIDTQPKDKGYSVWWYKGLTDFLWNFDKWNYKKDFPKPIKIAVINENQFWGIEQHSIWKPLAEQQGWQIVVDEFVDITQTDFASIITKIKLAKPDVILAEFFFFRCVMFIKQMHEMGVTANFVAMSESGTSYDWVDPTKGVGPGLGNGIITFAYVPKTWHLGGIDYLRNKLYEKYGARPGLLEASGFAAIELIAQAIAKAGSLDTDKLRNVLLTNEFETCYTRVKFDEQGCNTLFEPLVGQWINNDLEIIWPINQSTAKPIYPYSPTP
jgi:branched-chain amino acid transport system substrate-binding protein